jgi:hypothetical protein
MTDQEMMAMEEDLSQRAQELEAEVERLCKDLSPDDPDVMKLRNAVANMTKNIEAARNVGVDYSIGDKLRGRRPEPVYDWERLPVFAWNNEFAREIGKMLTALHKRHHIFPHNLAGQATLIGMCITMAHRDLAPGDFVSPEEVRAYLFIGLHATNTVDRILDDLSETTSLTAPNVERSRTLMAKIRQQFEIDLGEVPEERPALLH